VSFLFAGIAALALVELAVNLVLRPQSGPPALGAATLAYYYRTRGRCVHCGRL